MEQISLYVMMAVYIVAGLNHFRVPNFYNQMMPPWIPRPYLMVLISGVVEAALGTLLFWQESRKYAAWTIIAMLIVFLVVHYYMWKERNGKFKKVPAIVLAIRLPFQFVLIYWAYTFT